MTGPIGKLFAVFTRCNWLLQWLILSLLALLAYAPVIGNYFVNDDFLVLKKVCLDKQLNTEGFFRPLSDISIYANYLVGGFNSAGYTITSIVIHAFNALLLFHFCLRWPWSDDAHMKQLFAGLSAVFFLTYPSHNEPVVWLLGRASLLASTFAFLGLSIIAGSWRDGWKMLAVAICYFIAMAGYESVFVLPAIIFIWLLVNGASIKKIMTWMAVLSLVVILHFIVRVTVSGVAVGEYGSKLFQWDIFGLVVSTAKVTGRLLVPPVSNAVSFLMLVTVIGMAVLAAIIYLWKRSAAKKWIRVQLLAWIGMLLIALSVPFLFGVSTNTSESDRFLYFPSFFLLPLLVFLLLNLVTNRWLYVLVAAVLVANIIFLTQNNLNWKKASKAVTSLLTLLKDDTGGQTYVVNLPDEIDGAFVFRVGFRDALIIHQIDTARVTLVNNITRRELQHFLRIDHSRQGNGVFIPRRFMIQRTGTFAPDLNKYRMIFVKENDRVIYWNKYHWVVLQASALFK